MDTEPMLPQRSQPMPGSAGSSGARRRPSGEPPPLPRPVDTTTRVAGAVLVVAALLTAVIATTSGMRLVTHADLALLRGLERLRWDPCTDAARVVVDAGSSVMFRVLAWSTLVVLLVVRRFQHLFATLVLLLVVPVAVAVTRVSLGRMRPAGVDIVASWNGYSYPSRPVTEIALVLTIGALVLAPPGVWRRRVVPAAGAVIAAVVLARLYTAVDHPSDAAVALALGVAAPLLVLRMFTPEEAFPVTYRRGVPAHLDVGGRRGEAIRRAFAGQLDVAVTDVEPFSLRGSAGSTPLRITTSDGVLFGKLYASIHMRSDRWYKLARTVLYGRLEDEKPFNSVRRLVQYEDYMLRVLRDGGLPTAAPLGIVEITPEREYVLVTELVPDACEITDGCDITDDVDTVGTPGGLPDAVVDQALGIVRNLWDAGLAHRDIKPSNLLLAAGQVRLIDVAFAEVRPSPWRQAVDLANMMLTLGLCTPPARVYERALRLFTPDEVAEAFAAARAVTVPAQLRGRLRACDDDLLGAFRALAPPRAPVSIQRWTLRRAGMTLAVLSGALVGAALILANLQLAGLL